jgi:hypothetical protein
LLTTGVTTVLIWLVVVVVVVEEEVEEEEVTIVVVVEAFVKAKCYYYIHIHNFKLIGYFLVNQKKINKKKKV